VAFRRRSRQRKVGASTDVVVLKSRPAVVAALPLKQAARDHLSRQLGNVDIYDVHDNALEADLVLAPSCSPQAIAALKHAYPTARLVVVEIEDWEFDVRLAGPVKRLLDAGADAYLSADSLDELAEQLRARSSQPSQPKAGSTSGELGTTSVDDLIIANVADLLRRRGQASHGATNKDE
jgi:hypothetical protein